MLLKIIIPIKEIVRHLRSVKLHILSPRANCGSLSETQTGRAPSARAAALLKPNWEKDCGWQSAEEKKSSSYLTIVKPGKQSVQRKENNEHT